MAENLEEKKMAADGYSSVEDPVTPAGGEAKHGRTGADLKKKVNPVADTVNDGVTKVTHNPEKVVEEVEGADSFAGLFEGLDLSEDFKQKAILVFEAAVNEAAEEKALKLAEDIQNNLSEEFEETLAESLEEIVENLDSYLNYVVEEWINENEIAIESGIKVEMAESFMEGLKELFYTHNVTIDEEAIDIVSDLEEELVSYKEAANKAINERFALQEEVQALRAEMVFNTMTEGLSQAQAERFRLLSEKLDYTDLDSYASDLKTIKESFFKNSVKVISEDLDKEGEGFITEEVVNGKTSAYDSVNAYANFLKKMK